MPLSLGNIIHTDFFILTCGPPSSLFPHCTPLATAFFHSRQGKSILVQEYQRETCVSMPLTQSLLSLCIPFTCAYLLCRPGTFLCYSIHCIVFGYPPVSSTLDPVLLTYKSFISFMSDGRHTSQCLTHTGTQISTE